MDLQKNIEELDLVFLDVETTGLDPVTGDAICEIGMVKFSRGQAVAQFISLVNPQRSVSAEAYQVHKISKEELANAPSFKEIAEPLSSFIKNTVLCAYNARFDLSFLTHEFRRINYLLPEQPVLDVFLMVRRHFELFRYNLETAARHFNIEFEKLHRAKDDAVVTAKLFFVLSKILTQQGINSLAEYLALYGLKNTVFKDEREKKLKILQTALDKKQPVQLKWFLAEVKKAVVVPIALLDQQEGVYLLCQFKEQNLRIPLNDILVIE